MRVLREYKTVFRKEKDAGRDLERLVIRREKGRAFHGEGRAFHGKGRAFHRDGAVVEW